ncbi:zinc-finger domain-containing protein [Undibacterium fentianense]|uniref:Zinc-finger domain-containing protein n=1 Tax=Undibacterium fentianense TaxID=2828728 RepID=A0A941E7I3_9BURK|nr:zinc-finger domain-containing protein [Undibacterium fentianense]MBR7801163.1 zinc-finger domain-containing protein [Undibacterium fentianense]
MSNKPSNTAAAVELQASDLPAHCPNPAMPLWSSHPRVYLDLSHGDSATCSYCGTVYKLAAGTVLKAH